MKLAAPRSPESPVTIFRPVPLLLAAVAATVVGLLPIPGLSPKAHGTLVILVACGLLWMTEALPVAVTALMIPLLGVALGVTDAKGAFAGFGDPIVFLFLGTFLLTEAATEHGLIARLTHSVIGSEMVRRKPSRLLWAVALLGCVISAWINNTVTTAMLLPLALTAGSFGSRKLLIGVLLMTAYAPSLGGLATPVGTAPNLIGLRLLEQATGTRPSFAQWIAVFAPLAIVSTALTAWWLGFRAGPAVEAGVVANLVREKKPWSLAERILLPLFCVVLFLWIVPGILGGTALRGEAWFKALQARIPEMAVPMFGALTLFLLPSGAPGGARILDATVLRRVDWSTLMLFGGGLSLGAMMFESGLARAIGDANFAVMPFGGTYGVVLAATIMGVLVSELTSNTASTVLVVPVVLTFAQAAGIDPTKPVLAATVACSFGFMLPVSTPPNALVFATGRVPIREMISHGILLDLGGILLVSAWVTWLA